MQLENLGKLDAVQSSSVEDCIQVSENHRLCVTDSKSAISFLIDTGANVSVIPVDKVGKNIRRESNYKLYAANNTEIKTYGVVTLDLNLGLRRSFKWPFIISDVKRAIIGADFLKSFHLIVDLHNRKLIDGITELCAIGSIVNYKEPTIKSIQENNPYRDLLEQFPDITKPISFKDVPTHSVYHHIETTGTPVHARARPLPPEKYKKVRDEFRIMQEMGICRPSRSQWASPLHVVPKKDGQIRPCGDYRRLNAITIPDRYPVPRLQDFTYGLSSKKYFSRLDINRAYHFIEVAPEDVEKTAIITPFGLYEFPRMTFGLRNAAQTFQRFMNNTVLQGLEHFQGPQGGISSLFCYIDDVIIASDNEEVHKLHLQKLFKKFCSVGITINLSKSIFGKSEIDFLGYRVTSQGISPLPEKVQAIAEYPKPTTVEELRRFLGMINFYRSHLPNAAEQHAKLNKFIHSSKKRDKTQIEWDEEADDAFEKCKVSLQNAVTLTHPVENAPLALMTDASNTCVGAVLQQKVSNKWRPLGYFSKKLSESQQLQSTYDRELLAIYMGIIHFRNMVEGRHLVVYTDHKPLTYALKKIGTAKETPKRVRQLLYISEFTSDIQHVKGNDNLVADALSRVEEIVCPTVIDYAEVATAQEGDSQITTLQTCNTGSVILKRIYLPNVKSKLYCEISTNNVRPYLPERFRKQAFESVHNISHPGIKTSRKMITQRFFWPNMNSDIKKWTQSCLKCQKSKVNRHTVSKIGIFRDSGRFEHLHIDIVGPLPTSEQGYRYCVTMIDRFTHWPEAIPTTDILADTIAKVLYENWICRFGCPKRLTSDQGRQFESNLFKSLMNVLGITKLRTTPYHPQSNGMVERWHRSMKVALTSRLSDNTSWVDELPSVLFGLRAAARCDTGFSAAELVLGQTLRLPGDFHEEVSRQNIDYYTYVDKLREIISGLRSKSRADRDNRNIFVHKDLKSCSHVFIRNDAVKEPLTPTYDGPYRVLGRRRKVYKVQLPNRKVEISIDRLKPAYMLTDENDFENDLSLRSTCTGIPITTTSVSSSNQKIDSPLTRTTRSGRQIKPPVRFL